MSTREELEELPTSELHDRAMHRARRHFDVKFLWRVIEMVPAARMAAGQAKDAERDALHISAQVSEAFTADTGGTLATALRPVYIDYLAEHPEA